MTPSVACCRRQRPVDCGVSSARQLSPGGRTIELVALANYTLACFRCALTATDSVDQPIDGVESDAHNYDALFVSRYFEDDESLPTEGESDHQVDDRLGADAAVVSEHLWIFRSFH